MWNLHLPLYQLENILKLILIFVISTCFELNVENSKS